MDELLQHIAEGDNIKSLKSQINWLDRHLKRRGPIACLYHGRYSEEINVFNWGVDIEKFASIFDSDCQPFFCLAAKIIGSDNSALMSAAKDYLNIWKQAVDRKNIVELRTLGNWKPLYFGQMLEFFIELRKEMGEKGSVDPIAIYKRLILNPMLEELRNNEDFQSAFGNKIETIRRKRKGGKKIAQICLRLKQQDNWSENKARIWALFPYYMIQCVPTVDNKVDGDFSFKSDNALYILIQLCIDRKITYIRVKSRK